MLDRLVPSVLTPAEFPMLLLSDGAPAPGAVDSAIAAGLATGRCILEKLSALVAAGDGGSEALEAVGGAGRC